MTNRLNLGQHGSVTITRLAQKKYRARVRYRHIDGKMHLLQVTAPTRSEASRAVLEKTKTFTTGTQGLTGNTSIRQAADYWWKEFLAKDSHSLGTQTRYRSLIDSYLLPTIGDIQLAEATPGILAAYISSTQAKHGATNAKHLRMLLKNIFATAVTHDALSRNPVDGVPTVTVKREKVTRALSPAQAQELRTLLEGDIRDVFDLMLGTGCRISEALGLRWEDVDLEAGTITIAGALKESSGKSIWEPVPKSEGSLQTIHLPTFTQRMLQERRAWTSWVFPSSAGTAMGAGNFRKRLRKQLAGSELNWVTPHTARSTVATLVAQKQGAGVASALLGHSSEEITIKNYIVQQKMAPNVASILDELGRSSNGHLVDSKNTPS